MPDLKNAHSVNDVVRRFRTYLAIRTMVGVVMLLSWIVITNHCALGLVGPRAKRHTTPRCCHEPPKTPAKDGPAVPMVCCKTIKASLSSPSEGNLNGVRELAERTFATVQLNLNRVTTAPVVAIERGPPRVETFAERVLQSVLPSHAPPPAA